MHGFFTTQNTTSSTVPIATTSTTAKAAATDAAVVTVEELVTMDELSVVFTGFSILVVGGSACMKGLSMILMACDK